ncbi:MAG: hypothetical protein AAGI48_04470 [Verrucomicrobiota bacterium]
MKAHEIFNDIDPELVSRMLTWFRENDKNVYRSAIASLAQSRKLRLAFIQKKSLPDQYAWILKTLKSRQSDTIGEHLLQVWLMAGNQEMLASFCDAMGIEHDGKGSVTGDLPESLDSGELDKAVDQLVEAHDPRVVTLYLKVFNLQQPGGWDNLAAKLAEDERLSLS